MLLSDASIRARMAGGDLRPFREGPNPPGVISAGLTSAGYDLTLGRAFRLFDPAAGGVIDPLAIDPDQFRTLEPKRETHPATGREVEYVTLPPNSYCLAESAEWLAVPQDVLVVLLGKSTYARGAVLLNATPLEPGWRGIVTLEIGNCSGLPCRVYCGMGIAQALFLRIDRRPEKTYGEKGGRYQDQTGLTLPSVGLPARTGL